MPTAMDLANAAIATALSPNALIGDIASGYALITSPVRNIGGLFTDVTIEEVHNDRLEATQHPIQSGATVTDHSFALPATLTIRCGSSDCTAGFNGYIVEQYNAFLALQASRQPFSVSTGKRNYDNMLIRDLQVTTDERTETTIMFVVQLQQLTFTSAGQSSGVASNANQAFPSQTGSTTNMGQVALQPYSGPLPYFASSPAAGTPAVSTGTGIGSTAAVPFFATPSAPITK